ncbi:MAG: trans-4-hydroxy-L-proline dehydratase [Rikenellaceae bacterium]
MATERVLKLRKESLEAENRISVERAKLVTEFYKSDVAQPLSTAMCRAKCFEYILANKYIYIGDGEIVVGERGEAPKATPTYPEVCIHSIEDLEILANREKVWFSSSEEVYDTYRNEIIPFWSGKSNREKVMVNLSEEWKDAYSAGIFTEFQEQRAPGHTVLGDKIYHKGMLDIISDITQAIFKLDFLEDATAYNRREELKAMKVCCSALITFANRHADKLEELAINEADPTRSDELFEMARVCRKVPANAPETLHEALQYYWFVHLGVITEVNPWDSFNPGRLDQHLYPIYKKEIENGTITKEKAMELLHCFWIKFNNHPSPPKTGVTAKESNTYTDFCNINVGGLTSDGKDGVNEMSYMLLDTIEEMRLLQPSSNIQVSRKSPDKFIARTIEILKTGFGQPSIFNADSVVMELLRQGKSIEDARNGGCSGCVETGAFGKEAYILTGYFNLPKVLEITLHHGVDPRTGKLIGIDTDDIFDLLTMENLLKAFEFQLNYFMDLKMEGNNVIESILMNNLPVPFLSVLIDDCIENGVDYMCGGARYNSSYVQGVGIGTITDSLAAINEYVYERCDLTIYEFIKILDKNFEGHEQLRYDLVYNTPKYGNDDDRADVFAKMIFELYFKEVDGRKTPRGATTHVNLLPTTCHIYFGEVIGATPDGRKAHEPLSEGISPVQGVDTKGPTAVIKSAAKLDHIRTGGTLLNQKFTPSFFDSPEAIDKIVALVRSYFCMDGHHIQFNVVDAETLREAQRHPENYRDLIVRVAGYSDYFNDLGVELQNEIIERTAQN